MPDSPPATRRPLIPLPNRLVYGCVYLFYPDLFPSGRSTSFPPKKATVIPLNTKSVPD